jgi:hypothetical protein
VLYADQGKMVEAEAEAEAMILRVLQGYKKVVRTDHPIT